MILRLPNYPPSHTPWPTPLSQPRLAAAGYPTGSPRPRSGSPLLWPRSAMSFRAHLPSEPSSAPSSGLGPDGSRPLGGECGALPTWSWEANFAALGPYSLPPVPFGERGPQVPGAGRRCAAAYLGRAGPELQEAAGAARGPRARGPREGARGCAGGGCGAPARSCQARPPRAGLATRAVTAPRPSPSHALQAPASAPGPSEASGAAARGTRLRSRGPGVGRLLRARAAREGPAGPRV